MNASGGRFLASFALSSAIGLSAVWSAQQGGNQGTFGQRSDGSIQAVQQGIDRYLNGDETDSVVTPGDSIDYTLNLKAGQVVIGEARSEAFDPALEVVDGAGKVLVSNDDRYPGDQRPLIFWRCEMEGAYKVRVRSLHDKSGGQVFVRLKTYDSIDLGSGEMVEKEVTAGEPYLLRVPLKAGQVKVEQSETGGAKGYLSRIYNATIAPGGLPDINLGFRMQPAIYAVQAPVSGDYYIMETASGQRGRRGMIHIGMREIVPVKPVAENGAQIAKAPNNQEALLDLTVKKGEFLQVMTPELSLRTRHILAEQPDLSKFDLTKPETNPFMPHPDRHETDNGPAFEFLPSRVGDGRTFSFRARRDAKLWVATNARGPKGGTYTFRVGPAARELTEAGPETGKLTIANYDHWAFDAKAGEVMNFDIEAPEFREVVVVRDPDLQEVRHQEMELDQTHDNWRMIVQKPGRYLVTVSCLGEGGAGSYTVARKSFRPKDFSRSTPAKGEISDGEVQVWRFTATPKDPLFVHWNSSNWDYGIAIYDEQGRPTDFQRQSVDANNTFGILTVSQPQTYVIVLTGTGAKAAYNIDLGSIPGYKKG